MKFVDWSCAVQARTLIYNNLTSVCIYGSL